MNKVFRSFLLLLLLLSLNMSANAQKSTWPNTLLWKISGNGLKKPSYLFGTMHLQDKRIFNLGDSFYHHFERAEGFAIEVDFHEYMDSLLQKSFQLVEDRSLNDEEDDVKVAVVDTTIITSPPSAPPPGVEMKEVKMEDTKMSRNLRKEFRKLRNEQLRSLLLYGRMPTILDAYLYGMAMKQGKWLGAVEDVKDQLSIRDELGKDIDETEEMKKPEDQLRSSLGNMIRVYLAQDLNQIENISQRSSARVKSVLFNNRNIKMAKSMDSLSRLRSMFYAVGAAHLPGDSGVIKLLRQKGFIVTPVISTSTMAAEKYAAGLPSLDWYEVGQPDGLYTVDMPGIPSEFNLYGELVKMKVYVDITTMNFFMAGHSIAQFGDDGLESAIRNMAKSMQGKVSNIRKVNRDELAAMEATVSSGSTNYRVQILKKDNSAFFLMVGSTGSYKISNADADKFFYSFKAGKTAVRSTPDTWKEFSLPEKGVSVKLPVLPKRNKTFERQSEGTGWNFSVYDCSDPAAGLYYLYQVKDISAGRFLESDSLYFQQFRENLLSDKVERTRHEIIMTQGYPALRLDAESAADALFYKTLNLVRGNRVYTLMVLGHISKKDEDGPEIFFNSLKLLELNKPVFSTHIAENGTFSSMAPDKFVRATKEEEEDSTRIHYSSYDANEVTSYEVIKDIFPPLYWIKSDTAFYRTQANRAVQYNDSLLSYSFVQNGNIRGVEQLVHLSKGNMAKRMRYLLHGDTLYTLISIVPLKVASDEQHTVFFEKFRISNDHTGSSMLKSKAKLLLKKLTSTDSIEFANAVSLLQNVEFEKDDLPDLYQSMLGRYPDDSATWGSAKTYLIRAIEPLADSSTVDFVKTHYKELSGRGGDQMALLNLLTNYKNRYAYETLKELFIKYPPDNPGDRTSIGYSFNDSLELARLLFPEMLALLKNKHYWEDVADYTVQMIDSGLINKDILMPYSSTINYMADTLLNGEVLKDKEAWTWRYGSLVELLGHLNSPASNQLLQRFLKQTDLYLKNNAALCLLKNKQLVDAAELMKLAADNEYRLDLYNDLKKMEMLDQFPVKYKTQRYFAEAEIYSYATDEYSPNLIEFIGERLAELNGEKKRFFLFRIGFDEEESGDGDTYLALVGPYDLDPKNLETNNDATAYHYEEAYNKKLVDKHYRLLLEKAEEYIKDKKVQQ